MDVLPPSFSIDVYETRAELHFAARGRWDKDKLNELNWELLRVSKPFTGTKRPFRVLGDLTQFTVQSPEVAELMRKSQEGSAALGVERMAIVCSSALVRMQFQRVSKAMNLRIFENEHEALDWLRQ